MNLTGAQLRQIATILTQQPGWETAGGRAQLVDSLLRGAPRASQLLQSIDFSGAPALAANATLMSLERAGSYAENETYLAYFLAALAEQVLDANARAFLSDLVQPPASELSPPPVLKGSGPPGDAPTVNLDIKLLPIGPTNVRASVVDPVQYRDQATDFPLDLGTYQDLAYQIETLTAGSQDTVAARLKAEGRALYQKLFGGSVGNALAAIQARHPRVRVRLNLSASPRHQQVPWEMLLHPDQHQPLALSNRTSFVRWLPTPPEQEPVPTADGPLRLLVVASSVGGDAFDETAEIQSLTRTLQPLVDAGQLSITPLATPTLPGFQEVWSRAAVQGRPYHLLHITGHGVYRDGQGELAFSDGRGGVDHVGPDRLSPLLGNEPPRLIFLNLCQGATSQGRDAFSGVAQDLLRHQVPTVVGMQFSITNPAAEVFSVRFYETLAWGGDVEEAVMRGRQALLAARHLVEWVTPVLFLQNESLRLKGADHA